MSGGGTGGHIFPAIAIAQEIKKRFPDAEFLFIGANGKMEMEKVPQAGFQIIGLNIAGFDRGNLQKNFTLPLKLVSSLITARRIIKKFQPDFAIGTGGFASGPALYMASTLNIPTFVQEQNSLPGKTNKFLARKAKAVFTAYPKMEDYFPKSRTFFLGNPVRKDITEKLESSAAAKRKLGLEENKLTMLSVGGSLGSRTLNNAWKEIVPKLKEKNYQLIWQTGRLDYNLIKDDTALDHPNILIKEFISDMALAYSAADIIVSRAGAIAVSEIALTKKPALLVPFPFAAEDHQTKNAQTLVDNDAAKMVRDSEMLQKFWPTLIEMAENKEIRTKLSAHIGVFAKPAATSQIVDEMMKALNITT